MPIAPLFKPRPCSGQEGPGVGQAPFLSQDREPLREDSLKVRFLLKMHLSRKVLDLSADIQALLWSIASLLIAPRRPVLKGTWHSELQPMPWQAPAMVLFLNYSNGNLWHPSASHICPIRLAPSQMEESGDEDFVQSRWMLLTGRKPRCFAGPCSHGNQSSLISQSGVMNYIRYCILKPFGLNGEILDFISQMAQNQKTTTLSVYFYTY